MLPTFRQPNAGSTRASRSWIVVVAVAAGMLVLVSTFFQFHSYLHHAVAEHAGGRQPPERMQAGKGAYT
jgi:hypothetical protein